MQMKLCSICKCEKPLSDFYKNVRRPDGYYAKCKPCCVQETRAWRRANPDRFAAYEQKRASDPLRAEELRSNKREYRGKFPERVAANHAVDYALKCGVLKRQPCFMCGRDAVAHHPDYDRPLDVVWLCHSHHKLIHSEFKGPL